MRIIGVAIAALLALAAWQAEQAPAGAGERREGAWRVLNAGVASLEQFNYADAVARFRDALRIDPTLHAARVNLAIALHHDADSEPALKEALAAAGALPAQPRAWFVAGLAARAAGNETEALRAFERVLALDPSDAASLVYIGQIHLESGRANEAVDRLQRAVALEPFNATAAYSLGTALLRAGRQAEGQEAMKRFQALRQAPYAVTYASGYLQQGPYGEALLSTGTDPELVDPATPSVAFTDVTSEAVDEAVRSGAAAIALADVTGDGNLDLLIGGASGVQVLRRGAEAWTLAATLPSKSAVAGAVAADYDNDGLADIAVISDGGVALWRQAEAGRFEDVTGRASVAGATGARTVAWADLDHDGDVDLVTAGAGAAEAWRNNGNGTFARFESSVGLGVAVGPAVSIAPTDYDLGRDMDVLIAGAGGVALMKNLRENRFEDVTAGAGFPKGPYHAVAAGDLNADGRTDFFLAREAAGTFALSHRASEFQFNDAPEAAAGARAAQLVDYDADGILDLVTFGSAGLRVVRNTVSAWTDVSKAAGLPASPCATRCALASGDIDGDGDIDLVTADDGRLRVWRNDAPAAHSITIALTARVSNRSAVGARIEVRAGSLLRRFEISAASPAVAPGGLVFGLGRRSADVVRVVWPSGIVQAETVPPSTDRRQRLEITELDRKPSSCPYLYTWNGSRFEFLTDFLGGGEMGYWLAPGVRNVPDPEEYVRIPAGKLQARDGRYELRVTNELEEALFLDRLELIAVTHQDGVEVYPNEGLFAPPYPDHRLFVTRKQRVPDAVVDDHGHDVRSLVATIDRRAPDDFALERFRGYAKDHFVEVGLGPRDEDSLVLLLTAWTDYAFSSDNVAASQAGIGLRPPRLELRGEDGAWRTVVENIGIPVGRPQTLVVDVSRHVPRDGARLRIRTNMRIYWDRILLASASPEAVERKSVPLRSADLRWRGYSAEESPDGKEPFSYDYARVTSSAPWKLMPGRYTREGDVRELVGTADDIFVVSRPGDEVALSFDALPAPPSGWTRTFLLHAVGYSKEMDINSSSPDLAGPLPYRGMPHYPYDPAARPLPPHVRDYVDRYNTRVVTRPTPVLAVPAGGGR